MRVPREIALAERILDENAICNNCLGRQFPKFKPQLSNKERGLLLRFLAITKTKSWKSEGYTWKELLDLLGKQSCDLCNGIFEEIDDVAFQLIEKLSNYEFDSFLCGARVPFEMAEKEDIFRAKYKVKGESLRKEIIREVGLRLNKLLKKQTSFADPDIKITFEPYKNDLNIEIVPKPLFCLAEVRDRATNEIKKELEDFFLEEYQAESVKIKELRESDSSAKGGSLLVKIIHPKKRRILDDQLVSEKMGTIRLREVSKNFHKMKKNSKNGWHI